MIPGWVDTIEDEVRNALHAPGHFSALELAEALGISEEAAVGYITLLASSGRLRIEAVSLPGESTLSTGDPPLAAAA